MSTLAHNFGIRIFRKLVHSNCDDLEEARMGGTIEEDGEDADEDEDENEDMWRWWLRHHQGSSFL